MTKITEQSSFFIHNRNNPAKTYIYAWMTRKNEYIPYLCTMNTGQIYINAVTILLPAVSAAVCIVLTGFSQTDCQTLNERKLKIMLILYLSAMGCAWFVTFFYFFSPKVFVVLNTLCLASYVLPPILFYRIARYLTGLERRKRFYHIHALLPAALVLTLFVWSLCVPFDVQVELVESKRMALTGEYAVYSRFFTSKPLLRILFMTVYFALTGRLFVRYYRRANRPYSIVYRPARWVILLLVLMFTLIIATAAVSLLPREKVLYSTLIVAATACCTVGQHILLTYHIIRREYLLYAMPVETDDAPLPVNRKRKRKSNDGKLTKQRLESWFRNSKPYLNSRLKISDVVDEMNVNRSVVSSFINRIYGVSFSRYVNNWRLKELKRLSSLPTSREKNFEELCTEAGFRNIRHYKESAATERDRTRPTGKKPDNNNRETEKERTEP